MVQYSIREVIEQAIQTEKLGYGFYTLMSEKFKDNVELNELFMLLAGQELRHEKIFADLKDTLAEEMLENWEEASLYMRGIVESEFFLGSRKAVRNMEEIKSIGDAVRFAASFEKETLLYYYGLKDSVQDNETLNEIIREEKSHIRWLNDFGKKLKVI